MTDLIIDGEPFEGKGTLERALGEAADADMPLTLELLFVSEEEIRTLNLRERGIDSITDVLSFPAADLKAGEPVVAAEHADCIEPAYEAEGENVPARMYLGSVVLCEKRAREQAEEYGHSYEREVCYLIVHGFLHCLGYDHINEEDRRVMRAREEEIMKTLGLERKA